jgi:hypothetical protein
MLLHWSVKHLSIFVLHLHNFTWHDINLHIFILTHLVLYICTNVGGTYTHSPKCKQGVCHTVALPFTLESILREKKKYGNSYILL